MKNWVFGFLVFGFLVFFLAHLFSVSYLFHGIRSTYLRGESSAQIDDLRFFYNREVLAENPVYLPIASDFSNIFLSPEVEKVLVNSKSVAFLVIQKDSVRVEKYWNIGNESYLSNSFSVAKSIVSLLIGCAIDDGYISSVEQSIFDFLPEISPFEGHDVKIKHLLEMSSGLDWVEHYTKPISITAKSYYGKNLEELVLGLDFIEPPGKTYRYLSGNTQLLGLILSRAVGENISSYTSRALWSKVGAMKSAKWTLDKEGGVEKTFCCFNSSARDFSKIGLLMLGRGKVFQKRVVSESYVDWLLKQPDLIDGDISASGDKKLNYYSNGWWTARVFENNIFYARGFRGQYVVVVPDLDLVFVRLGMFEDDSSSLSNDYTLTDDLLFLIESVIKNFS